MNHVVDATRRLLRSSDMLFRHEDDQFIAVLLHTAEPTAAGLAERLSSAVATSQGGFPFDVRVSTALAVAPRDSSDFEGLLDAARHRLTGGLPAQDPRRPNDRVH